MALSRSPEPAPALAAAERDELGRIARAALVAAVEGRPWRVPVDTFAALPRLARPGASFVTLHARGELRGCIGSIEPRLPLAEDVAANARAAALEDARFEPVAPGELAGLELEISVLSPLEPLPATSRPELLAALRPGEDGLLLTDGFHRATFLPAVWEQLPEPAEFLAHLERKAGLPAGRWSTTARFARYRVESFRAEAAPPLR